MNDEDLSKFEEELLIFSVPVNQSPEQKEEQEKDPFSHTKIQYGINSGIFSV